MFFSSSKWKDSKLWKEKRKQKLIQKKVILVILIFFAQPYLNFKLRSNQN